MGRTETIISIPPDRTMITIQDRLKLPSGAVLRNRIIKAAMSEALGDAHNNPTEGLINLFGRWSKGGAALLVTGNTPVDRWHLEHAGNFVLDAQSDLEQVSRLARAARSGGALALAQLSHAGRQTPGAINPNPLSISDQRLDLDGYGPPKEATEDDLNTVIAKFVESALRAQKAGFDGVEIHAAHGYLLSASLSPRINTRQDDWGGRLENRARLPLSVVKAVRASVGDDFIVAVKLNSSDFQKGGFDHADSIRVAQMLEAERVDFIEISGGNFEFPTAYQHTSKKQSTIAREGYFLKAAAAIKSSVGIPIMVTGGFRTVDVMNAALAADQVDLIGMARPFIIDPEFPTRLLNGSCRAAPAVERDFPAAETLPRGAVLNWFCDQLVLHGTAGEGDPSAPLIEGHERYLARIRTCTDQLLSTRSRDNVSRFVRPVG